MTYYRDRNRDIFKCVLIKNELLKNLRDKTLGEAVSGKMVFRGALEMAEKHSISATRAAEIFRKELAKAVQFEGINFYKKNSEQRDFYEDLAKLKGII